MNNYMGAGGLTAGVIALLVALFGGVSSDRIETLEAGIAVLEARQPEKGEPGPAGPQGPAGTSG